MRTYYVIWTYAANYSKVMPIQAASAQQAAQAATSLFSDDFREKGSVYVFDTPPAFSKVADKAA
jgi:hypothetical protein